VLAVLVVLCAVFVGAGAAALSPKQYKAQLAAIATESNSKQAIIQKGLQAKTVPVLVAALKQFAASQDKLGAEVAALKPPANAAAANAQLAKGLHDIASAVREVEGKVKGVKTVKQATTILDKDTSGVKAGQEVDAALAALNKLGYA